MEAIFASKFYKTSPRKEAIKAALENPINSELVTQLKSYLSEETLREIGQANEPKAAEAEVAPTAETEGGPSKPSGGGPSGGGHIPIHIGEDPEGPEGDDTLTDEVIEDFNEGEPTQLDEEAAEVEEEIESTTDIDDEPADLQGQLDLLIGNCPEWVIDSIDRTSVRHDDEFWLYFNDDTNLNKVMTPVIDTLDPMLKFNRLARANNAIVFEIDASPIKTVDEVDTDAGTSGEQI